MKKSDLVEKIKRNLGYPVVKVELDDSQINDAIDITRQKYIRWAIGNATQERYWTLLLSAGQSFYDMPSGCVEVIGYDIKTSGSIHTLFTIENYMYNQGMYDMLYRSSGSGYTLVSYHIARDFLDTVKRYVVDAYTFKYHRYTNLLEIIPPPASGGVLYSNTGSTFNSPGYILCRGMLIEGLDEDLFENYWVISYATAYCKKTLGVIRSKFANFTSIGQTGISLDGDNLISQADAEMEKLEETLRLEEAWEGYDITIG
jgi:hypothetical protein